MAPPTRPFAALFVPTDILREIFSYLQPGDLLRLCGVCRYFRTVSLVVLFTGHCSHFCPHGESLSFSSSSAEDLAANLGAIRKVTSRANKASADLAVILASLTRMFGLEELDIRFLPAIDHKKETLGQYTMEAFVQWRRGFLPPAVFMISKGEIKVSGGPCPLAWDWRLFVPRRNLPLPLSLALHALRPPPALLRDSSAMGGWKAQISRNFSALRKADEYTTMNLKSLPLQSSVRSWNLLALDVEKIRVLTIGHVIPTHRWSLLLPHINLPALQQLAICKDARLPMSDLLAFCSRHPKIHLISFEHYSLTFDVRPVNGESHFPSLDTLEAPLHYFDHLLPFIDATRLREVSVGKHPYNKVRGQRHRPARRVLHDRLEKRFDFKKLDSILHKLSQFPICSLALVIPGGSKSKAWLRQRGQPGRAGPLLPHVETLLVRSEFDVPFTRDTAVLFPGLCAFCPAMTKFRCRRVDTSRGTLVFLPPVTQEVGYVCAINDQPEVVDVFANIRCTTCGHYER